MRYYDITLTNPRIIASLFISILLTFLFYALTMNTINRATYRMMHEYHHQFTKMRKTFRTTNMSEASLIPTTQKTSRILTN
jgi:Inorganic pyrophosphatase